MRILVIEDDVDFREALKSCLENAQYKVDCAATGTQGSLMGRTKNYDAILLDLCLPGRMGNAVCTEVRAAGKNAPIVVMSVEADTPKKIELLNLGADDFLIKPFSLEELLARLRAVLRRPQLLKEENVLKTQHIVLDLLRHQVFVQQKEIHLTRKEFLLLEHLVRHKGIVMSRSSLLERVWDDTLKTKTNTIETHIRSLRKKMAAQRAPKIIHTIPGYGYVFDEDR